MKVAFLGKGGSGKSTMAVAFAKRLLDRGTRVLAIDADHNMDLTYSLGIDPSLFVGTEPNLIKEFLNLSREISFTEAAKRIHGRARCFTAFPPDPYTASVTVLRDEGLRVMTAGPHTEQVRSQEACSHSLAAPLKLYLPLLALSPGEAVVIDERAGTDPVATGILSHVDLAVIVRENTIPSIRVSEQIKNELEHASVPYLVLDNKVDGIESDAKRIGDAILCRV